MESLLQQSEIRFADKTYTMLSGQFQQDRHLIPSSCMPTSFLFEAASQHGDALRECRSEPEQYDDLLKVFSQHQRLVLLGEPGAGKTFSLWRIAAEQAKRTLSGSNSLVPVIIPLNRWTDEQQSLQDFVLQQMGALAGHFAELRRAQRLLPLLDALNEIPFDQRRHKLPQVKAFVQQADFKQLVLSCRQRDYQGALEQDMDRLTIEPLDPPRIQQFLRNYFAYFAQQRPSEFTPEVADELFWQLAGGAVKQEWGRWQQHGKGEHWQDFWTWLMIPEEWIFKIRLRDVARTQQLNDPRSLLKLAANPYLLFLMTTLYERYGELPRSRIDLFGRFVKVLLEREEVEKARCREYVPERDGLLQQLKQLAWQLQSRSGDLQEARTVLSRTEASQILAEPALEFAAAANLLEINRDSVRFSHQLLQEFFTAQRFKEERDNGLKASQLWPADCWWEPNGWEEVAKLAAEYEADPKPFLQWLAEGNPKLAAEIARTQQLSAALLGFREQWQSAITDIKNYPSPHERHAISTVLAWLDWDQRKGVGLNAAGLPDIDWVEIPAGKFIYQKGERLTLPTYYMSRYPVTNTQFQAFIADGGYETDTWWQGLKKPDDLPDHRWTEGNRPVERVNWYECIAFCRWLSAQLGYEVRLPMEQEWEKAARGEDGHEYPWGDGYKTGDANIDETWKKEVDYYLQQTSAVGLYPQGQSPYGLQDMAGNVWEWCLNKYDEPTMLSPDASDASRVVRGGSWRYDSEYCRSSFRRRWNPLNRDFYQGFRLLCFPPIEH